MSISVVGDGLLLSQKGDLVVGDGTAEGRLAVGTDGQILTASSTDSLGVKWIDAPASTQKWTTISTALLTAVSASIEFTGITQGYDDLKIIGAVWHSTTQSVNLNISVATTTTGTHWTYGVRNNEGSLSYGYNQSDPFFQFPSFIRSAQYGTGLREYGSVFVFDIKNYASTTNSKSGVFYGGWPTNSTTAGYGGQLILRQCVYNSTSAINYIKLYPASAGLEVGSYATLIGIKRS